MFLISSTGERTDQTKVHKRARQAAEVEVEDVVEDVVEGAVEAEAEERDSKRQGGVQVDASMFTNQDPVSEFFVLYPESITRNRNVTLPRRAK
jgi:hypothetical protein